MSDILTQIKSKLMDARKNKDVIARTLLTTLLGEIDNLQRRTAPATIDVASIVVKFIKNANETLPHVTDADAKATLETEISILEQFLPKKLTQGQLDSVIDDVIAGLNLSVAPKPGDIMSALKSNYTNQYDAKSAMEIIKRKLQ